MFLSRNKTNNVYPCKPQFYYIKVGFTGALYRHVFVMYCSVILPTSVLKLVDKHSWIVSFYFLVIFRQINNKTNAVLY